MKIKKENIWEPARANWPVLMIEGDLESRLENTDVLESDFGLNLNPPGTPWQGKTDTDISRPRSASDRSKSVDFSYP